MRLRFLLALALMAGCATPALAATPCCDSTELRIVGDINYETRAALGHTGDLSSRLLVMGMAIKAGTWRSWNDPDRGLLLGLMAATPAGQWAPNRTVINEFAGEIGVVVKNVSLPVSPPPVVVVPPAPPPVVVPPTPATGAGVIEAEVRRIVQEELAKLVPSGGSTTLPGSANPGGSVTVEGGEGELTFRSNLLKQPRQEGIASTFVGSIDINGWDGGLRFHQNVSHVGTRYRGYFHFGGNSRGAWEYNWFPAELGGESPDNSPASVHGDPSHPIYKAYRGQGFIIDQGTQPITDYGNSGVTEARAYSRRTMIGVQREAWPLVFVVSPIRPNGLPVNWAALWIDSDGGPNPVRAVIDGRLQRLKSCDIGGVRVVCL